MRFSRTWHHPAQLEFRFEFAPLPLAFEDDEDGDEWAQAPFIRVIGPAAGRPAPVTAAPRSVFDLAGLVLSGARHAAPEETEEPKVEPRYAAVMEIADGIRRCVGAAFPSRWTPEDEERERQRRARQRPPKPTKKARTKGKKLVELVGEN
jgi:hypothetical protein